MNRFVLLSLYLGGWLFLGSCSKTPENSTQDATKNKKENVNFQTVDHTNSGEADQNSIANKIFSFNRKCQDCNAQTFSKEWSTMKFNPDGTVSSISAMAKNTGGNDFYELRQTSFGSYTRQDALITIEFTKTKSEKIKEGKTLDSNDRRTKTILKLKVTKCADERLQLVSSMPNKNAQGKLTNEKMTSCWVATR